jgi:hypothetical protein
MFSVVFGNLESGLITSVQDRSDDKLRTGDYLYLDEGGKTINTTNWEKFYLSKNENGEVIIVEKQVLSIKPDNCKLKVNEVIELYSNIKIEPVVLIVKNQELIFKNKLSISFGVKGTYRVFLKHCDQNAKVYMKEFYIEVVDA